MLAIKAPPGSSLIIPDPHRSTAAETGGSESFRAFVSSKDGPLAVWLLAGGAAASSMEAAAHRCAAVRLINLFFFWDSTPPAHRCTTVDTCRVVLYPCV